jgi:sulfide dehydrogenase cytochrome subunit
MKAIILLSICLYSLPSVAYKTPDGEKLFQKHCSECHQKDGNSTDENIPRIAQFSAILTYDILDQFKSGDRKAIKIKNEEGQLTDMMQISKSLKAAELEAISLYLSTQKTQTTQQIFDMNLAKKGREIHLDLCENCHVDEATNPIEDAPILSGQWKSYLTKQFESFTKRERYMPKRMKKRFKKLSDDDKSALIEFYISPK